MTARATMQPRLMTAPMAAAYLGVSATKLRELPIPRKALGSKRLYEIADLDAYADSLPYVDAPPPDDGDLCADEAFGVAH